jgi:hypothetical protein
LGVVWRDREPDRGVALAPDHRGLPMGPRASIPRSGSGQPVWASLRATTARHGHPRSTDCTTITMANWVCREAHRVDPTGMPRPHDRIRPSAPAPDPSFICNLLFRSYATYYNESRTRQHGVAQDVLICLLVIRRRRSALCPKRSRAR